MCPYMLMYLLMFARRRRQMCISDSIYIVCRLLHPSCPRNTNTSALPASISLVGRLVGRTAGQSAGRLDSRSVGPLKLKLDIKFFKLVSFVQSWKVLLAKKMCF